MKRDCSQQEIKYSYRRLALEHHPDKNRTGSGNETGSNDDIMKKINFAYEILSDTQKE